VIKKDIEIYKEKEKNPLSDLQNPNQLNAPLLTENSQ
jgi:hypothetical protein